MTDKIAKGTEINHLNFETELNNGGNKTTVNDDEEEEDCFLVYFTDTTHTYKVYNDGRIESGKTVYCAITYVLNGGTNPQGQKTSFKRGETVSLLNATKDNAYFQGWYESSDFSTDKLTSISNKNEDITLYAKWVEETPAEYFNWTTTETEATITGFSTTGLSVYNAGNLSTFAIPNKYNNLSVTAIDKDSFKNKNLIKELLLPETIQSIGNRSFKGCTGIEKLTLAISLNSISENPASSSESAFADCTNIKEIHFTKGSGVGPDLVTTYYTSYTYNYTPWYNSRGNELKIIFDEGITKIGNRMFQGCTGVKNISFPNSLEQIGEYAFSETSIESVEFPNKITTINKGLYYKCSKLINLNFNENIQKIEADAFRDCIKLKELSLPETIQSIGNRSFKGCTGIEKLTLAISLNSISENPASSSESAFADCTNIKEIHFTKGSGVGPDLVTTYYTSYTYNYTPWYNSRGNELKIIFDEGITKIGNYMFYNCTGLNKVIYKNNEYTNLSSFKSIFVDTDGGTISSSAFTGSGF